MLYTLQELESKNVISICDGKCLGHICDLEIDSSCGKVTAVYIMMSGSFWLSGREETRIPWENIRCIGEDAVLVDFQKDNDCSCRKGRRGGWGIW